MIKPEGIPKFLGDLAKVSQAANDLSAVGGEIISIAKGLETTFRNGMNAHYTDGPEKHLLVDAMLPVKNEGDLFGTELPKVASALHTFVSEVQANVNKLNGVKGRADAFIRKVGDTPEDEIDDNEDWVKEENQLHKDIEDSMNGISEAEHRCANKIVALFGGKKWDEKSGLREGEEPPKEDGEEKDPPWGKPLEYDAPWYEDALDFAGGVLKGIFVDGLLGTLEALTILIPIQPLLKSAGIDSILGYELAGWDQAGAAWKGVGLTVAAAAMYAVPGAAGFMHAVFPETAAYLDTVGITVLKGMVAWDMWGEDPGRALGQVGFNVITTIGTGGAAAGVRATAIAGRYGAVAAKVAKGADVAVNVAGKLRPGQLAINTALKLPKVSDLVIKVGNAPVLGDLAKFSGLDIPSARGIDLPTAHAGGVDTPTISTPDHTQVSVGSHSGGDSSPSIRTEPVSSPSTGGGSGGSDGPTPSRSDAGGNNNSSSGDSSPSSGDSSPSSSGDNTPISRSSDTPSQPHNDTPAQPHSDMPAQPHSDTPAQPRSDAPSQSHTDSASQSHTDSPDTSTAPHSDTPTTSHPDTSRTDSPSTSHTDSPNTSRSESPNADSPSTTHSDSPSTSHTDSPNGAHSDGPAAHTDSPNGSHSDSSAAHTDSPNGTHTDSPAAHTDSPNGSHTDGPSTHPDSPSTPAAHHSGDSPSARTPDSPSNHTPDAPRTHSPDSPTTRTPDSPSTHSPDAPRTHTNSPDSPRTDTPDAPAAHHTPDQPATHTPDSPTTRTPDSPNTHSPDSPSTHSPDSPTTRTPDPVRAADEPAFVPPPVVPGVAHAGRPGHADGHGTTPHDGSHDPAHNSNDLQQPAKKPDENKPEDSNNDANQPKQDPPPPVGHPGQQRHEVEPTRYNPGDPTGSLLQRLKAKIAGDPLRNVEDWITEGNPHYGTGHPAATNNCGDNSRAFADNLQGREPRLANGDLRTRVDENGVNQWAPGEYPEMHQYTGVAPQPIPVRDPHGNLVDGEASPDQYTQAAYRQIHDQLQGQPPGTVAVIGGQWAKHGPDDVVSGHWFNAFVDDTGKVRWADMQTGHIGDFPPGYGNSFSRLEVVVRRPGGDWHSPLAASWRVDGTNFTPNPLPPHLQPNVPHNTPPMPTNAPTIPAHPPTPNTPPPPAHAPPQPTHPPTTASQPAHTPPQPTHPPAQPPYAPQQQPHGPQQQVSQQPQTPPDAPLQYTPPQPPTLHTPQPTTPHAPEQHIAQQHPQQPTTAPHTPQQPDTPLQYTPPEPPPLHTPPSAHSHTDQPQQMPVHPDQPQTPDQPQHTPDKPHQPAAHPDQPQSPAQPSQLHNTPDQPHQPQHSQPSDQPDAHQPSSRPTEHTPAAHDRAPDPSTRRDRPPPEDARPMDEQPAPPDPTTRRPADPRVPHTPDPHTPARSEIDARLNPDGPPKPHDPNRIENALRPDGPPAPHAPRDPNRIDNALHPDGPPAPHGPRDPNRIDNALNPDRPRDPREDFMQDRPGTQRDGPSNERTPDRPATHPDAPQPHADRPRDPREDFMQNHQGTHPDGPSARNAPDHPDTDPDGPVTPAVPDRPRTDPDGPGTQANRSGDPREDLRQDTETPRTDNDHASTHDTPEPTTSDATNGPDYSGEGYRAAEPPQTADEFAHPAAEKDKASYRRIREADDVQAVADNVGLQPDIVDLAKQNLFMRQHAVWDSPTDLAEGFFEPLPKVGQLWEKAARGEKLSPEEKNTLRSLVAHEYVETKLMEAGLPYRKQDPAAWDEFEMGSMEKAHIGAHNASPLSLRDKPIDLLRHWDGIGLVKPAKGIAPDLSNLDDVVRAAMEGLGL